MKLFLFNLFLLLSGNDADQKSEKINVASSAKAVIETLEEAYSAKEPIEAYSAKSAKDGLLELPLPPPDMLMNRMHMPIIIPIIPPPINPPPVTNVNP